MSEILFLRQVKKESFCFLFFDIIDKLIIILLTKCPIKMGFTSKCSIFKLPESGVKISNCKTLTCDSCSLIVSHMEGPFCHMEGHVCNLLEKVTLNVISATN